MDINNLTGLLIISLKSTAIYIFIVFAIRLFGKKELAQLSVIDLVFILLISNAVQNAMVGQDSSVAGGIAAASGLFVVNYVFKYLLKKFPKFSDAVQGHAVLLIYKGNVLHQNCDHALFTMDELKAAVREHGIERIEDVDLAVLEVDGNVSIVSNDYKQKTTKKRRGHRMVQKTT
jgi:uncharacterized membrane protein YcaP (DUF421 family)